MKSPSHNCDAQARAGMWVIGFMGAMGVIALLGIIVYSMLRKITPEAVVLATLGGTVTGAMSGLPSLLARMSGQPEALTPVHGELQITGGQEGPGSTVKTEEQKK